MPTPIKYIISILAPIVLTLCLLSFGNPQWGSLLFRFQAEVWPAEISKYHFNKFFRQPALYFPSDDFSGTWRVWNETGLISVIDYEKGVKHGVCQLFNEEGRLVEMSSYKNGRLSGYLAEFLESGKIARINKYVINDKSVSVCVSHISYEYEADFSLASLNYYPENENESQVVFNREKGIDQREKFSKEIEIFKKEFVLWEKKHNITP